MDFFKKSMDASMNAAFLTGLIIGQVKHNDKLTGSDKVFLLRNLMETHIDNPISSSDDVIKQCKQLLEGLEVMT